MPLGPRYENDHGWQWQDLQSRSILGSATHPCQDLLQETAGKTAKISKRKFSRGSEEVSQSVLKVEHTVSPPRPNKRQLFYRNGANLPRSESTNFQHAFIFHCGHDIGYGRHRRRELLKTNSFGRLLSLTRRLLVLLLLLGLLLHHLVHRLPLHVRSADPLQPCKPQHFSFC